nr:UDP-glucuronosyl UDP-glucosyltransferase domain containing protein [Haemonchus contortus]
MTGGSHYDLIATLQMAMLLTYILVPVFILNWASAYKMVLLVADVTNSNFLWSHSSDVKRIKEVKIHHVNASIGVRREDFLRKQTEMMFLDLPIWDYRMRATLTQMTTLLNGMCQSVAKNKEFLDWIVAQKFDLAFAYMADACPVGIIHYAKIPTWIWLSSAGLVDFAAYYMGVPMVPSYSPPITMESTDEMNFFDRTKSLLGQILLVTIWQKTFADQETAIFREIDPNFPHIVELAQKCPLVMVNSNELYEFPRPTLAKIVNVGGVGIQLKDVKPLNAEFQRIVDKCEGLVVFSFGSVAPSHLMPNTWKTAFLEAFARFPNLNFVLRYEGEDLKDRLPPNVYLFKWLPQTDLLRHPKTIAIITHGGYNSLQEVINTGVPMITVALWGDQPRNAKMAAKLGIAVNLQKNDISTNTVTEALNKLFAKSQTIIVDGQEETGEPESSRGCLVRIRR